MQRWHVTVGLGVVAVGAGVIAPTLVGTTVLTLSTLAPSEEPEVAVIVTDPVDEPRPAVPLTPERPAVPWHRDADGDGFGDRHDVVVSSARPLGYVLDDTDCDDRSPRRHPGATEIPGDGIDSDCDGRDPTPPAPPPARPAPSPRPRGDAPTLLIPELDAPRPRQAPEVPDSFWDSCPTCGMG